MGMDRHRFLPCAGIGEEWPLHGLLGQDVVDFFLTREAPAFMPGDDLVGAGGNVGELEASALVGYGVVRMRDHHHLGIHPDVAAIAAQVDQAGSRHGAGADFAGEGEWQVETGGAVHVDGVQSRIGALHLQIGVLGHQQNVGNVAAVALIEVALLLGELQRLAGGDVL